MGAAIAVVGGRHAGAKRGTGGDGEAQDDGRAIRGRGAFRRFKDLVARYPKVQEQWYAYQDAQARQRLMEWLEDNDIELIG